MPPATHGHFHAPSVAPGTQTGRYKAANWGCFPQPYPIWAMVFFLSSGDVLSYSWEVSWAGRAQPRTGNAYWCLNGIAASLGWFEATPERVDTVVLLREARRHSDLGLVEECRKGDTGAFDELVRRYKDRLYNVVYRSLGNHEDTLDVCQEVFVRAYRGITGFEGKARVYTWLYSIALNLARNRLRDAHRKGRDRRTSLEALEAEAPSHAQEASATRENPRDLAMGRELEDVLQGCLEELPDHYRMAFVLRTFEDLSYEEIADIMGCPTGTVKSRLNKARRMLRDRLRELAVL